MPDHDIAHVNDFGMGFWDVNKSNHTVTTNGYWGVRFFKEIHINIVKFSDQGSLIQSIKTKGVSIL